jgi:hypothetical protein
MTYKKLADNEGNEKKNLTLIIVVSIISLSIIIGAIIISNSKEEQKLEYYCDISQERLNNIGCTTNDDCISGKQCDTKIYKCVDVQTAKVCYDLEETNCSEPIHVISVTQRDCEKIGGDWELRLIE